jgi:hypothetical protein
MGAYEIAAMTSETVLHPICVSGNAFTAQAFQFRTEALGARISWVSGEHRAHRVAQ